MFLYSVIFPHFNIGCGDAREFIEYILKNGAEMTIRSVNSFISDYP